MRDIIIKILSEEKRKNFMLSSNDRNYLLSAYEDMGYEYEWAQEDLDELVRFINRLPKRVKLYRVILVDEEGQIDREKPGSHYSMDKENLLGSHMLDSVKSSSLGNEAYLITVKADKGSIDIMETLHNNILYPHEKEITLYDKGKGAEIIDIEKL
jgi:hypothetical protein